MENIIDKEPKWYVLHTFTGYENVAKENLMLVRENFNLHDRIFDIVIPMEDVVEEKKGKQVIVSKKVIPGYILIKMIYGDDIWHAITRTRGVTGFTGPNGRALALTEDEIRKMHLEVIEPVGGVKIGDSIEIVDGVFSGTNGKIVQVYDETKQADVSISVFGRDQVVKIPYTDIKKI